MKKLLPFLVLVGCSVPGPSQVMAEKVTLEEYLDCRAYTEPLGDGLYGECAEPVLTPKGRIIRYVCAPFDRGYEYACFQCGETYSTLNHPLCVP